MAVSDDIPDYYMTPMEQGKSHIVKFDHVFVGREALKGMIDHQRRERVTLVWNDEDVIDVYGLLFDEGETNQFIHLPDFATRWSAMHYDTVLKDGEVVGLSKHPGYLYYKREILSLAAVDLEYSDPCTEETFLWGDQSAKRDVELNKQV